MIKRKVVFSIDKVLRMPATDFCQWDEKHYVLEDNGDAGWHIECFNLRHMAEALLVLNFNDHHLAFNDMKRVEVNEFVEVT